MRLDIARPLRGSERGRGYICHLSISPNLDHVVVKVVQVWSKQNCLSEVSQGDRFINGIEYVTSKFLFKIIPNVSTMSSNSGGFFFIRN